MSVDGSLSGQKINPVFGFLGVSSLFENSGSPCFDGGKKWLQAVFLPMSVSNHLTATSGRCKRLAAAALRAGTYGNSVIGNALRPISITK